MGDLERLVLLAVLRLGSDAYAVSVRREITERTGRQTSRGAVYVTLDRLEGKGYLSSELGEPTPERGGRAKRFFRVEAEGLDALRTSMQEVRRMSTDLDDVLGLDPA